MLDERGPANKRFRRDEDPTNPNPSIVVHVRNLNANATETDLIDSLTSIGPVAYVTCMPNKGMALVEFESLESARQCVSISQQNPIDIGGAPALFNYSTSQFIQRSGLESERPNHILAVTVSNAIYPVNVRVLYKVYSPYGGVLRIAIIRRNGIHALVEMESLEVAKEAKYATNGADIYTDCCTLKVEYAKSDSVKMTRNNLETWDFELNPDGPGPSLRNYRQITGPSGGATAAPAPTAASSSSAVAPEKSPFTASVPNNNAPPEDLSALLLSSEDHQLAQAQQKALLDAALDSAAAGTSAGSGHDYAPPVQPPQPPAASVLNGEEYDPYAGLAPPPPRHDGYGGAPLPPRSRFTPATPVYDDYDHYSNAPGYENDRGGGRMETAVLMLYGVEHVNYDCSRIFNLLCCYGNVHKVKFIRTKPDTCMVQMASPHEALNVLRHLDGVSAFGQPLSIRPSKQNILREVNQEPFQLENGKPSFQDFYGDRHQRFNNPNMASRNRIVYPSAQLHFFNVPISFTEQQIMGLFTHGVVRGPVPANIIRFNCKNAHSSSGLVTFNTTDEAVEALMIYNHSTIQDVTGTGPYTLKLTFSGAKERDQRGPPH